MTYKTIEQAVTNIKQLIEDAIRTGGVDAKNNLIRTQVPICMLHDAAKASFINMGVNPNYIHPPYDTHTGELKLAGFFKFKDQDICILPKDIKAEKEILTFDGILKGKTDTFGFDLTEKILSVNVRSQLSSVAKNFDTLYERTIAESMNFHSRCPNMVLGEFYMIPVYEYDDILAKQNIVGFKPNNNIQEHIQKYISSFSAINNRATTTELLYKYERVCLLIVDFNREIPKIYNSDEELRADHLLGSTTASIEKLNFSSFASSLMNIYEQRFGNDNFK